MKNGDFALHKTKYLVGRIGSLNPKTGYCKLFCFGTVQTDCHIDELEIQPIEEILEFISESFPDNGKEYLNKAMKTICPTNLEDLEIGKWYLIDGNQYDKIKVLSVENVTDDKPFIVKSANITNNGVFTSVFSSGNKFGCKYFTKAI